MLAYPSTQINLTTVRFVIKDPLHATDLRDEKICMGKNVAGEEEHDNIKQV